MPAPKKTYSREFRSEVLNYWNGQPKNKIMNTALKFHISQETVRKILDGFDIDYGQKSNFGLKDGLDEKSRTYNFNWLYKFAEAD